MRLSTVSDGTEQHEVSLYDEVTSTPQGRAMMKCVEERDELRNLLDLANRTLIDASCLRRPSADETWMCDYAKFREGYEQDLEKR